MIRGDTSRFEQLRPDRLFLKLAMKDFGESSLVIVVRADNLPEMTTTANPLSIYETTFKGTQHAPGNGTGEQTPPGLWRNVSHDLFDNDLQIGIAEYRRLSGVQFIRARHAYPSFDWQWVD